MEIIVATKNEDKMREIREILSRFDAKFISQHEADIDIDVEETGKTFEENALLKARAVSVFCDAPVLADDSGLCVDALDGRPGIYSARYAGEGASDSEKIKKVLDELEGAEDRSARFVSVVALVFPDGREITARGEVEGTILTEPRGDAGFGYDPIFYSSELKKSFGEASEEEKNKISHRKRALEGLCERLDRIIEK